MELNTRIFHSHGASDACSKFQLEISKNRFFTNILVKQCLCVFAGAHLETPKITFGHQNSILLINSQPLQLFIILVSNERRPSQVSFTLFSLEPLSSINSRLADLAGKNLFASNI